MKRIGMFLVVLCLVFSLSAKAGEIMLEYDISYKNKVVGTQTVQFEKAGAQATLTASTDLKISVMFVTYRFDDQMHATFLDGTVEQYTYRASDDGKPISIEAETENSELKIKKVENKKTSASSIEQSDYDLHSWSVYLFPESVLARASGGPETTRVFSLEDAVVEEQRLEAKPDVRITVNGKPYTTTLVNWRKGKYVSQSWHSPDLDGIPVQYLYEDENGQTIFTLKKWSF